MKGYIRRHRKKWMATYDAGKDPKTGKRRQVSKTFAEHAAAEDWLADKIHGVRNLGIKTDPTKLTLGEWLDAWVASLADDAIRESTRSFYGSRVRNHIKPAIGHVRLRDLSVEHVREFYAALSPTVRDKVHSTLRPALSDAVEQGKLAVNPAIQAKRRRRGTSTAEAKRRKWHAWTEEELNAFLDHVRGDRLEPLWRLYAMTGARRGELIALRWPDVSDASIRIERAYVYASSRARLEGTKTGRERSVDLDETTAASLEVWRKSQISERLKAGSAWKDEDWVFTQEDGSVLEPHWVSLRFRKLLTTFELPRIRLHDLRHTHASLLLKAGVPVHVVAERLGHSSPTTTMSVYAHMIGSQQRDAARLVEQMLANARPETARTI